MGGVNERTPDAAQLMVARDLRAVPVLDQTGAIIGLLDEHDVAAVLAPRQES